MNDKKKKSPAEPTARMLSKREYGAFYVMEKRCRNDVVVSENDLKRYMQLGYTVICAYFDGHRYKNIHRLGGKYEFVYS